MVKLFLVQSLTLDHFLLAGCTLVSRVDVAHLDAALESCVQIEHDLIKSEKFANLRLCLDDDVKIAWFSESSLLSIVHYRLDGLHRYLLSFWVLAWKSDLRLCLAVVVFLGFLPRIPGFTYYQLQFCDLACNLRIGVGQSLFPPLLQ